MSILLRALISFTLFFSLNSLADDSIKAAGALICRVVPGKNIGYNGITYKGQVLPYFNEMLTDLPNDSLSVPLKLKTVFITIPICDPSVGKNKDNCKKDFKRYSIFSDSAFKAYLGFKSYDSEVSKPEGNPEFETYWKESYVQYKETQFVTLGKYQYWGSEKSNKVSSDSKSYFLQGIFYEYSGDYGTLGFGQTEPKPTVNLRGVIKYRFQGNDRYWAFSSSECKLNNW